jgi:hypothetical protein
MSPLDRTLGSSDILSGSKEVSRVALGLAELVEEAPDTKGGGKGDEEHKGGA